MTARAQGRIAWSLAAATTTAAVVGVLLAPAAVRVGQASGALPGLAFAVTGAVIVVRADGNVVGWLLAVAGISFACSDVANLYAYRGLVAGDGGLPAVRWAAWATTWTWVPGFVAGLLLLPLVFPSGSLPSPRWRPAVISVVAVLALHMVLNALAWGPIVLTDPLSSADLRAVDNPLGVPELASVWAAVDMAVQVLFIPMLVVLTAIVRGRYRRAAGVERYQLRWFLLAVVLLPIAFLISALAGGDVVLQTGTDILLCGVPVSIGVAVLRYRLYEIDRVVSRTVSYSLVTVALVGLYVAIAVLPSALLDVKSDLLVAAATLAAAAAFVPVRRRVQAVVDGRFNRARYDARRVVERFGAGLRDDVDLVRLTGDLRGVVASTVQPAHVSLWLRTPEHVP